MSNTITKLSIKIKLNILTLKREILLFGFRNNYDAVYVLISLQDMNLLFSVFKLQNVRVYLS